MMTQPRYVSTCAAVETNRRTIVLPILCTWENCAFICGLSLWQTELSFFSVLPVTAPVGPIPEDHHTPGLRAHQSRFKCPLSPVLLVCSQRWVLRSDQRIPGRIQGESYRKTYRESLTDQWPSKCGPWTRSIRSHANLLEKEICRLSPIPTESDCGVAPNNLGFHKSPGASNAQ